MARKSVKKTLLNDQQESFCQAIADGLNRGDAYTKAYPGSVKWTKHAIAQAAHVNLQKPHIVDRIKELKSLITEKYIWTREQSIKALTDIVLGTCKDEDGNEQPKERAVDRIAAIKELNNMEGFIADKKVVVSGEVGLIDALQAARQRIMKDVVNEPFLLPGSD